MLLLMYHFFFSSSISIHSFIHCIVIILHKSVDSLGLFDFCLFVVVVVVVVIIVNAAVAVVVVDFLYYYLFTVFIANVVDCGYLTLNSNKIPAKRWPTTHSAHKSTTFVWLNRVHITLNASSKSTCGLVNLYTSLSLSLSLSLSHCVSLPLSFKVVCFLKDFRVFFVFFFWFVIFFFCSSSSSYFSYKTYN